MSNPFADYTVGVDGPAIGAIAITPSDSTKLPKAVRAITIGGVGGTLSFVSSRDGQTYTTGQLPPGTYPIFADQIRMTGTTASGLTGWV